MLNVPIIIAVASCDLASVFNRRFMIYVIAMGGQEWRTEMCGHKTALLSITGKTWKNEGKNGPF
jgi:hypothetical protein